MTIGQTINQLESHLNSQPISALLFNFKILPKSLMDMGYHNFLA